MSTSLDIEETRRVKDQRGCILLATGVRLKVTDPKPGQITIRDIGMGLANQSRFHGQRGFYSIAQHSVRVMQLVDNMTAELPISDQQRRAVLRAALLHDAEEAFIGDLASPTKELPEFAGFVDAGKRLRNFILEQFGCAEVYEHFAGEIDQADDESYFEENRYGFGLGAVGWTPENSYIRFAKAYHEVRP